MKPAFRLPFSVFGVDRTKGKQKSRAKAKKTTVRGSRKQRGAFDALNPDATEFVPKAKASLTEDACEFVPSSYGSGRLKSLPPRLSRKELLDALYNLSLQYALASPQLEELFGCYYNACNESSQNWALRNEIATRATEALLLSLRSTSVDALSLYYHYAHNQLLLWAQLSEELTCEVRIAREFQWASPLPMCCYSQTRPRTLAHGFGINMQLFDDGKTEKSGAKDRRKDDSDCFAFAREIVYRICRFDVRLASRRCFAREIALIREWKQTEGGKWHASFAMEYPLSRVLLTLADWLAQTNGDNGASKHGRSREMDCFFGEATAAQLSQFRTQLEASIDAWLYLMTEMVSLGFVNFYRCALCEQSLDQNTIFNRCLKQKHGSSMYHSAKPTLHKCALKFVIFEFAKMKSQIALDSLKPFLSIALKSHSENDMFGTIPSVALEDSNSCGFPLLKFERGNGLAVNHKCHFCVPLDYSVSALNSMFAAGCVPLAFVQRSGRWLQRLEIPSCESRLWDCAAKTRLFAVHSLLAVYNDYFQRSIVNPIMDSTLAKVDADCAQTIASFLCEEHFAKCFSSEFVLGASGALRSLRHLFEQQIGHVTAAFVLQWLNYYLSSRRPWTFEKAVVEALDKVREELRALKDASKKFDGSSAICEATVVVSAHLDDDEMEDDSDSFDDLLFAMRILDNTSLGAALFLSGFMSMSD